MEYRFQLTKINSDLKARKVTLTFSLDVDEDTVQDNIYLMSSSPKKIIATDVEVDGRTVSLMLHDTPIPNKEYTLVVEPEKVESVTGDILNSVLPLPIIFESAVVSDVKILSPSNFDTVSAHVKLEWQEISTAPTRLYRVEVATEKVFSNVVISVSIDKNSAAVSDDTYSAMLPSLESTGQYFIRMRAEQDDEYGPWSDIVTVVIPAPKTEIPNPQPGEKERPEFPEIVDYVDGDKKSGGAIPHSQTMARQLTENRIAFDEMPLSFDIDFSAPISIENATIKVERRSI